MTRPPTDNPEVIRRKFASAIFTQEGAIWCRYKQFEVTSAFQRIYNLNNQVVGVEALARPFVAQQPCSPLHLMAMAKEADEHIFLDRLLRAVHLRNFANLAKPEWMLFLNHDLESLIESEHNLATRALYQSRKIELGLQNTEIVVEILEQAASCEDALALSSRNRRVCEREMLALDDVTDTELVYQRCNNIQPDIIKLDISVLTYPHYQAFAQRMRLPGVIIVQEGIETEADLALASQHCDLLQGYFLHRPQLAGDC